MTFKILSMVSAICPTDSNLRGPSSIEAIESGLLFIKASTERETVYGYIALIVLLFTFIFGDHSPFSS